MRRAQECRDGLRTECNAWTTSFHNVFTFISNQNCLCGFLYWLFRSIVLNYYVCFFGFRVDSFGLCQVEFLLLGLMLQGWFFTCKLVGFNVCWLMGWFTKYFILLDSNSIQFFMLHEYLNFSSVYWMHLILDNSDSNDHIELFTSVVHFVSCVVFSFT